MCKDIVRIFGGKYPVMKTYMPQTPQDERWRRIRPSSNKEMTYGQVLRVCPHSERNLKYRVSRYRTGERKDWYP